MNRQRRCFRFLAGALLLASSSWTEMVQGSWAKKDWTVWSVDDCNKILSSSPWAKTVTVWQDIPLSDSITTKAPVSYTVRFESALPVREARARLLLIQSKTENLEQEQRMALEAQVDVQLSKPPENPIIIGITIDTHGGYIPDAVPWQVLLILSDGTEFSSRIPLASIKRDQYRRIVLEVTFTRAALGQPIIKPGSGIVVIRLSSARWDLKFDARSMLFDGRLEY